MKGVGDPMSIPNELQLFTRVRPLFPFRGGNRQTLLGAFAPTPPLSSPGIRHEIQLEDGDILVARFHGAGDPKAPLALLFHGLGGSMESNYIHEFTEAFLKRGASVLRVNHRGVGEGMRLSKGIYHSGRHKDLGRVVQYARATFAFSETLALGFSFSGNLLLNLLARETENLPDYSLAVNPSIDLAHAAKRLQKGLGRIYDRVFVRDLLKVVNERKKIGLFPKEISLSGIRHLHEFDERITAPLAGYVDRFAYYAACSSAPVLRQIQSRTAVLSAKDDPIVGGRLFQDAEWSPSTKVFLERHGGHLGYIGRSGKELVKLSFSALESLR
jgi:uncharacterized protein